MGKEYTWQTFDDDYYKPSRVTTLNGTTSVPVPDEIQGHPPNLSEMKDSTEQQKASNVKFTTTHVGSGLYEQIVATNKVRTESLIDHLKHSAGKRVVSKKPPMKEPNNEPISNPNLSVIKKMTLFYTEGDHEELLGYLGGQTRRDLEKIGSGERFFWKCLEIGENNYLLMEPNTGFKVNIDGNVLSALKVVITSPADMSQYYENIVSKRQADFATIMNENKGSFLHKDFSSPVSKLDTGYLFIEQGVYSKDTFLRYNQSLANSISNLSFLAVSNEDILFFIPMNWVYGMGYSKIDLEHYLQLVSSLGFSDELIAEYKPHKEAFGWINNNLSLPIPTNEFLCVKITGENENHKYLVAVLLSTLISYSTNNFPGMVMQIHNIFKNMDIWSCFLYASVFNTDSRIASTKDEEISKNVRRRIFVNIFSRLNSIKHISSIERILYSPTDLSYCTCDTKIFKKFFEKFDYKNAEKQFNEYKNLIYGTD